MLMSVHGTNIANNGCERLALPGCVVGQLTHVCTVHIAFFRLFQTQHLFGNLGTKGRLTPLPIGGHREYVRVNVCQRCSGGPITDSRQ
jgi:hypothetical protein